MAIWLGKGFQMIVEGVSCYVLNLNEIKGLNVSDVGTLKLQYDVFFV